MKPPFLLSFLDKLFVCAKFALSPHKCGVKERRKIYGSSKGNRNYFRIEKEF